MIPAGRVCTYGLLARFLELPSARMAGYALRHIPDHLCIPAHRVVNAAGRLSGSAFFEGVSMAERLTAEGIFVKDGRVQNFNEILWDPTAEIN